MILYVETNFILSIASGKDAQAMQFLQNARNASVTVAIPTSCYMEALVAFEEDRKRRNNFRELLNIELTQARRDQTAIKIRSRISALEQSGIAYDALFNEVESRFLAAATRQLGFAMYYQPRLSACR